MSFDLTCHCVLVAKWVNSQSDSRVEEHLTKKFSSYHTYLRVPSKEVGGGCLRGRNQSGHVTSQVGSYQNRASRDGVEGSISWSQGRVVGSGDKQILFSNFVVVKSFKYGNVIRHKQIFISVVLNSYYFLYGRGLTFRSKTSTPPDLIVTYPQCKEPRKKLFSLCFCLKTTF